MVGVALKKKLINETTSTAILPKISRRRPRDNTASCSQIPDPSKPRPRGRRKKVGSALTRHEPTQPRKRGRPRKNQNEDVSEDELQQSATQSSPPKKRRGRPRKVHTQS